MSNPPIYLITSTKDHQYDTSFITQVTLFPEITPPEDFYKCCNEKERKRIYTHLQIWKRNQTCIIIEDRTYTNLSTDDLFYYLTFGYKKTFTESDTPAIFFYGKYCDTCLSHDEELSLKNKYFYKTEACHGAYAYMVNAQGCKSLAHSYEKESTSVRTKTLDEAFFVLTHSQKLSAWTYHPSLIKLKTTDVTQQYECLLPDEEETLRKCYRPASSQWSNWFIFFCIVLLILLLGLALYYVYRIGMTSGHHKIIKTGYAQCPRSRSSL